MPRKGRAPVKSKMNQKLAITRYNPQNRGRETKLTPELQQSIVKMVEMGNYLEVAAQANGIHYKTLHLWLQKGNPENEARREPYITFYRFLKKAEAEAENAAVMYVRAGMAKNWPAAMTFLERRHRHRWGRFETQVVQNPDGSPVKNEGPQVHVYVPDNGREKPDEMPPK